MATPENIERLKTRRKDIADAEALGEDDAVEGFMPVEQSEFESREDYRGYKMPKGMSLPQRRAYKKAIDERENFRSKAARQLPRQVEDYIKEPLKDFGRSAKEVGKGVGEFAVDAALTVPRAKAAMYTDPEGSKEFMGAVASGDREARKQLATGASESMVEPAATMGDAALTKYAAEEGDYGTAALYGASVLLPFVSVGWLKAALKAGEVPPEAAKKIADLEKRYEAGDVTDDMQVRRELAQIEDDHAYDYQASLGERDTDFDFESVSGKPPSGGRSIDERLAAEGIPVRFPGRTGPRDPDFEMRREISTRDAFYGGQESGGKLFRIGDRYIEAANVDDAIRLATNEDGFEHYIAVPDIQTRFNVRTEDDLRRIITEASPEESAKYFDMKGGGRSIDDIEGPSEAEIQQMVETSKFGDPEELEMMKEDMRRMAELEQGAQIESGRVRRSRTPGAAGASGKVPEGTSRADRSA